MIQPIDLFLLLLFVFLMVAALWLWSLSGIGLNLFVAGAMLGYITRLIVTAIKGH